MTKIIAVRHGFSYANFEVNEDGTPGDNLAFAQEDAELRPKGIEHMRPKGEYLEVTYPHMHIKRGLTRVAASTMRRAEQSAEVAGFSDIVLYDSLREVDHQLDPLVLSAMLKAHTIPPAAKTHIDALLASPPKEVIWFTHGLDIIELSARMPGHETLPFKPAFGEVREYDLDKLQVHSNYGNPEDFAISDKDI